MVLMWECVTNCFSSPPSTRVTILGNQVSLNSELLELEVSPLGDHDPS